MKKAYVFIADGFEEVEAIFPSDIMRRAGVDVLLVSCGENTTVKGAHGIPVVCDVLLADVKAAPLPDAVILPGGLPGAENLADNDDVHDLVLAMNDEGRIIASICASPALVFAKFGVLKGKKWTCYPGMEEETSSEDREGWKAERVVVDGNLITSRGPGTAGEFGFKLVEELLDESTAQKLRKGMLCE